jgi:hypothetical protein
LRAAQNRLATHAGVPQRTQAPSLKWCHVVAAHRSQRAAKTLPAHAPQKMQSSREKP